MNDMFDVPDGENAFQLMLQKNGDVLSTFESVSYVRDSGKKKIYSFSCQLDAKVGFCSYCKYVMGSNYVLWQNKKIYISDYVKKQLYNSYESKKNNVEKMFSNGTVFCNIGNWYYFYLKKGKKYIIAKIKCVKQDKDSEKLKPLVSKAYFYEYCILDYDFFRFSEYPRYELTYCTALILYKAKPEIEEKIKDFNEIEALFFLCALKNGDEFLVSSILYMHDLETEEDIEILSKYVSSTPFFFKKYDLYDESILKIKTIEHKIPKCMHQTNHYQLLIEIEGKSFYADWEFKNVLYIHTWYKHRIEINISTAVVDELTAVQPQVKEVFKTYDASELLKLVKS